MQSGIVVDEKLMFLLCAIKKMINGSITKNRAHDSDEAFWRNVSRTSRLSSGEEEVIGKLRSLIITGDSSFYDANYLMISRDLFTDSDARWIQKRVAELTTQKQHIDNSRSGAIIKA